MGETSVGMTMYHGFHLKHLGGQQAIVQTAASTGICWCLVKSCTESPYGKPVVYQCGTFADTLIQKWIHWGLHLNWLPCNSFRFLFFNIILICLWNDDRTIFVYSRAACLTMCLSFSTESMDNNMGESKECVWKTKALHHVYSVIFLTDQILKVMIHDNIVWIQLSSHRQLNIYYFENCKMVGTA